MKGGPVEVAVVQTGPPAEPKLNVTAKGAHLPAEMKPILKVILERILGLQIDMKEFYRLAMHDGKLKPLAQKYKGMKPPRYPTVFEALVNAITCQQFTLTSGIRMLNRLVATWGVPLQEGQASSHAFPRPEDLAGLELDALRKIGFSRQKARALIDLARMVMDGRLDL